jgi:O6-methylguanine-DNA--protein-cysteine methyltransferase
MLYYDYYQSPRGRILLVADDQALTGVYFTGQKYHPRIDEK